MDITVKLDDLTDRLERVQYTLYQTENPDTRFDKIYEKLSFLEANRMKSETQLSDMKKEVYKKIENTMFDIAQQMNELDVYKKKYESMAVEI